MPEKREPLVAVYPCEVEGRVFERGEALGEVDAEGTMYPAAGVTVGHLMAKRRLGMIQVGPMLKPAPDEGGGEGEGEGEGGGGVELPADFPGREPLVAAGHGTVEVVAGLTREQLLKIDGIAKATADKIAAALAAE